MSLNPTSPICGGSVIELRGIEARKTTNTLPGFAGSVVQATPGNMAEWTRRASE
jgi:hypothetical protein